MSDSGRLEVALGHIGTCGNLDGLAIGLNERMALVKHAQDRGLIVWNRWRGRYYLSPAGHRRVAVSLRSGRTGLQRPMSAGRTMALASFAVLAAGCVALGAVAVTSHGDTRKAKASPVAQVAAVAPSMPRAEEPPWRAVSDRAVGAVTEPAFGSEPAGAKPAAPAHERRAVDADAPVKKQRPRKEARTNRPEHQQARRERRYDASAALGFAPDARVARRGYPSFPGASGTFGTGFGYGHGPQNRASW